MQSHHRVEHNCSDCSDIFKACLNSSSLPVPGLIESYQLKSAFPIWHQPSLSSKMSLQESVGGVMTTSMFFYSLWPGLAKKCWIIPERLYKSSLHIQAVTSCSNLLICLISFNEKVLKGHYGAQKNLSSSFSEREKSSEIISSVFYPLTFDPGHIYLQTECVMTA